MYKTNKLDLILLVDDSNIDNFVTQKMIERNHFAKEVIAYTKAGNALKYLSDLDELKNDETPIPSLIFLDLNMPMINGFKFLEIYEKLSDFIKSRCKIIVLTSSVCPNDRDLLENKNILAFLHKP